MASKKILKQEAMADVRIVEEILRRWDPIGVKPGVDGPLDEYDSYAPNIVSLVKAAATTEILTDHLENLATVTIGLQPGAGYAQAHSRKFASEIIEALHSRKHCGTKHSQK